MRRRTCTEDGARRWRRDLAAVRPVVHGDEPIDVDVYQALARLTLRQRSVVFLAYWHDMTEAEIADVLAMSHGAGPSRSSPGT